MPRRACSSTTISATFAAPIPNDTSLSLVAVTYYNQAFVADKGANPSGATLSNGTAATVGRR